MNSSLILPCNFIIEFDYTNWKGETEHRHVKPERVFWSEGNEYHPEPQWLMRCYDFGHRDFRNFAMKDMRNVRESRIEDGQNVKP